MTNHKEYIYAVCQEKSFSKAAQRLFVSQPWLSATVKKVEQELGLPLFDRSTNPISLTQAGQYYMEQIQRIMSIEAEMAAHFKQLRQAGQTELRIGSSMFFCTYVLPALMEDFRLQHPQTALTFVEGGSQTLAEKLLSGQLDILLEAERPERGQITSIPWASEEIILAVPAENPINQKLKEYCYPFDQFLLRAQPSCRRPAVPLARFAGEPFLLLKEGSDCHDRGQSICQNAGFAPTVRLLVTQMMTAYYLVCEGQGVTFLRSTIPEHVAPTGKVVFYQLDDPLAVRSIYLSYPRHRTTPMQQKLIDFMQSCVLL